MELHFTCFFCISNSNSKRVCMCVFPANQPVDCVQIMSGWSSNLRQGPLWSLKSVANCDVLVYLTHPSHSSCLLIFFQRGHPASDPTPPPPTCLHTESSDHLCVTCVFPSIPMPPTNTVLLSVCAPSLRPFFAPVTPTEFLAPPQSIFFLLSLSLGYLSSIYFLIAPVYLYILCMVSVDLSFLVSYTSLFGVFLGSGGTLYWPWPFVVIFPFNFAVTAESTYWLPWWIAIFC